MMSIGSKFFGLKKPLNVNSRINLNGSKILTSEMLLIDNVKKGYSLTEYETENKTKYLKLKKDTNETTSKVIYYIHGGSYIKKLTTYYESFIYPLCDLREDLEIILLDYSLAPEHKYPTQLNEALDVWNEICKKYNSEDIIIGGDSTGGALAIALIQKLKKDKAISPKASFFISPWTDMTCSGKSYYTNYQKDTNYGDTNSSLTEEKFKEFKNSNLFSFIGTADRNDPYVSPIFSDFSTFPKSLFIVGGDEMLLDDTINVVNKIKENSNNEVTLINKDGMFHNFPLYINFIPESNEAYSEIKNFIIKSF